MTVVTTEYIDELIALIVMVALIGFPAGWTLMKVLAGPIASSAMKMRSKKMSWILQMNLAKQWKFNTIVEKLSPLNWKAESGEVFTIDSFDKIYSTVGLTTGAIFVSLNAGPMNKDFEDEVKELAANAVPQERRAFLILKISMKPKMPTLPDVLNNIEAKLTQVKRIHAVIVAAADGKISRQEAKIKLGYSNDYVIPEVEAAIDNAIKTRGQTYKYSIDRLENAFKITTNQVTWNLTRNEAGKIIRVGCKQKISADTIMALAPRAHKLDDVKTINERSSIAIAAEEKPSGTRFLLIVGAGVAIFIVLIALKVTVGI